MKAAVLLLLLTSCFADPEPSPPTCIPGPTIYRIDTVVLPQSNLDARGLGFDLDDDRTVDNLLGQFAALLRSLFGADSFDLEGSAQFHLATDTDWRLAVWGCDGGQQVASIRGDEDPLDGFIGYGTDPVARGRGGELPLGALWDVSATGEPGFVTAEGGAIEIDRVAGDQLDARIDLAIEGEAAKRRVVVGIADAVDKHLVGDVRADIDTNRDGRISELELFESSYVQALLAPDVEIEHVKATSFGLAVHAVRVP